MGVDALIEAVGSLCRTNYAQKERLPFSAKAYRVRRVGGVRYTYVKVTGGILHARDEVQTLSGACKVAAVLAPQGGKLLTMGEAHARGRPLRWQGFRPNRGSALARIAALKRPKPCR